MFSFKTILGYIKVFLNTFRDKYEYSVQIS